VVVEVSTLPGAAAAAVSDEGGGVEESEEIETEDSESDDSDRDEAMNSSASRFLSRSTLPSHLFDALAANALRRDFTVNALYFDPATGALHDPTGLGVSDAVSAKAVRVASARGAAYSFSEDPARGIRAIRLASRAKLKLTPAVEAALVSTVVAGGRGGEKKEAAETEVEFEPFDSSSLSSSSSSSSPLLSQVPASRRAHELAALFAYGGSRRALALLWRYELLDLLLPEHARWLAGARVPRKSRWKRSKKGGGGGEEGVENDDDDDDDADDADDDDEDQGSSSSEAASSPSSSSSSSLDGGDDDNNGNNEGEKRKASAAIPLPPPRLRSLPGVESLAALDVAASATHPAPSALWAAALAMPLVASAALAEGAAREEKRRWRGKKRGGDGEEEEEESEENDKPEREAESDQLESDDLFSFSPSSPSLLPRLRRFRFLVHEAVETMGAGGHHHVSRAVRAGAEALILRAAAAELEEAEAEAEAEAAKVGGKGQGQGKGKALLLLGVGSNAFTQTRRQQNGGGGGLKRKEVWETVLAGAGKWAAIAEGVVGVAVERASKENKTETKETKAKARKRSGGVRGGKAERNKKNK